MASLTDAVVRVAETGQTLRADCVGNNAAVECPICTLYPVLMIAVEHQQGTGINNPAICRHCGARFRILDDVTQERLAVVNIVILPAAN
jgi:hypothetical protein